MNNQSKRLLTILLALFMIFTSFPLNAFAAQTETNVRNEITDIRTVGDKQVINLGTVKGQSRSNLGFFSRSARLFGARTQQAGSSSETVAQKVEISLDTMGLNLEEDQFDPSALTEVGSFDVKITFKELGGRAETRTMTFQVGETKKTETFYLPKDFGNGNVEAEIPKLKQNISLRVYNGAGGTTNFTLGQDMTYKFELTQIVHPVIDLKVVDPYGKELQENINQPLGLKLTLKEEHDFNLPANTKTFNIRTLTDFAGTDIEDLNSTGDNPTLSITTQLQDKKLTVGGKTYKLNKITYKAIGQEVEINGHKKKVGGYIEFTTQPKIIVPTPDDSGVLPKTPDGYKRLSFHAETSANSNDGRFENGEKLKVIDVLEGTEFKDKDLLAEIAKVKNPTAYLNGSKDDSKKFLKWNPALPTDQTAGEVADTDYWPVYLADGGEITPGEKLPDGVFEVKVIKDDTIAADPLYGKSYGVFKGSKLRRDKFPDLEAEKGHQNPKWTTEADAPATGMVEIKKPWTKVIEKNTTFKATAAKDAATQIGKDGLKAVDTIALQGQELTEEFWHKGVALADNTPEDKKDAFAALLKDATVTDKSSRTTAEAGDKVGILLVTFKDGSTLEVPNQKLIVKPNTVEVSFDNEVGDDAKAPRHKETVVKGKVTSKSGYPVKGAVVEIKDEAGKVIGITQVIDDDGNFTAGTRELKAGEKLTASVTLPDSKLSADSKPKTVKLNADRLKDLLPIAQEQYKKFKAKENAFIKDKLEALNTAITTADPLIKDGKATATDTAENQTAINNAVKALEEALKALTANIPPTISGPKTHEIFVGQDLDLKKLVDVTDGDGADDLVEVDGSKVQVKVVKVDGQTESPVANLATIKDTVGTYKVTYTAEDKAGAEVTHEMTLTVKPRTNSAIEVTKDPTKMSYLITEKDGKAQLNLEGMTLNLVDNLGKKTKVELTDKNVKFKVNGKEIKNGGDLTLADDVQFIEVEYKDGDNTLTAKTNGVLRVGPDYDGDGTDDRTKDFDASKIEKLEVIKQPKLDYIAKDSSEADKVFKLNLEGMIIRMTDKAGKEKLAVVKEGKFVDYDDTTKAITVLTATPAHGATLTPETSATVTGDNGKTVKITGPNNSKAETDKLKVFYDANKDGKPDHGKDQKTPSPSAMARNVGEKPEGTTVEGMATPGAVIKITDKDGAVLTTEPEKVVAGPDGKYTATIKPLQADGTDIKVTAKLGEMKESDPTPATVFDDKNDNKQPDRDEGFNIAKATDIKFVDQPDLTYLVATKDKEVTFDGKDGKGKPIYLELSYKNGDKTESKIMTLEELMKDTDHIAVTPANGTKDKIGNNPANLVGKNIEVKLVKVDPETATSKATSKTTFAIEIDADGNGKADKEEKTPMPSILSARNIKDGEKIETKVLVKGEPGATITIKSEDGQTTLGTGTVGTTGKVEIKLNSKQEAGTKIQAIAKLGEMEPSDPAESIVFDDLDNDGKPDGQGKVDFDNIVDMRIASDPKTMSYAVKSDTDTTNLKLDGLTVYVKDKNGNTGIYQYGAEANKVNGVKFEELKGNANFKLELVDAKGENPAAITDQTTLAKANDANKVKVSIAKNTDKSDTTGPLNVFVDANGNGVDDDKEKIDLTKVTSIKVISQPELNYPITEKDGKTNLDLTKMVVAVSDGVTTANYTAEELLKAKIGADNAFKLTLVDNADAKKADITTITGTELTTANDQNKVKVALAAKETVNDKTEALEVFEDLDKDGKRDTKQTPAPKDLKALNVKDDAFTTITGKAQKGDTLKVYGEDKKEIPVDKSNISIDDNGNFTIKVSKDNKALPKDSLVFVTAQADKKDESPRTPVVVKVDADGSGTADSDETTTITSVIARNIGTGEPKQKATFTTIEGVAEKGSKVTITFTEKGKQKATTKTVDADVNTGKYKLELNNPAILLDTETVVKASAKFGEKKDSPTIETKVFDDLNADGKDDKAAEQKSKMPQNVRAMNQNKVGQDGKVTNEAKDTTTVKGKVTPGATVKITSKDGKTDLTPAGGVTVDENGNFTAEIAKQKDGAEIKVTATEKGKLESDAAEATVFRDADNNEADDSKATTERPSALAYNFKDEAKTTIKGEAEPGATVVAKVGKVEVGTATAGADGKYTIEATKDGAKLPKGTKVSVTAKLAPKGESPAQETVVYDDLDGDGQPDTSQAFDKDKIRGLEVVASPDKMVYNNKEQLDLTGMKVLLTDQMGNKKIVKFSEFTNYGITVSPVNNIELSDKEVADGGNNGQKIKAEVKVTIDNNQVTYPGETPTALTVNKDQSAKPTDVTAANQGDDNFTKVRFKAADGAKIKIYKADDAKKTNLINGTLVAGTGKDAGYFIATLNTKLPEGTLIEITSQETGKSESSPEEAKVVRDKNGDWKDDAGNIKLTAPDFEDVKVGDKSVKVEIPTDQSITKIIVQDQAGNEVEATKEMEGEEPNKKPVWKVNGKPVEKDGKLDITTDPTLKFGPNQIVKVIVKDAENNEGSKTKAVQPANLPKMPDPIPDSLSTQDTKVTGKSVPGAIVKVQLPGQTEEEAQEALVKSDGSFEFVLPNKLADKDKVIIIAESPGKYQGIGKATVTVGLNLKELENTNREADKLISDSKTGNNFDPENNKYDKNLEEKSKKAKDVLEKAKDKDDDNDPTQTKVDDAEKELREAIAEKIADTAVDKAKDDPSDQNIKDAQDKIDAIPGTVNDNPIKKELQDKLDLIKKIKEAEDRLKQDDVTGENDTPKKPQEDIDKLKKAIQDGKDALNKEEKDKYGEKTTEIEKAITILNQERLNVTFKAVSFGDQTLFLRTSVPGARITVSINGKIITKSKVRNKEGKLVDVNYVTTDGFGAYTLYFGNINEDGHDFTNGLSENDEIVVEATKDGYNPGEYTEIIY